MKLKDNLPELVNVLNLLESKGVSNYTVHADLLKLSFCENTSLGLNY